MLCFWFRSPGFGFRFRLYKSQARNPKDEVIPRRARLSHSSSIWRTDLSLMVSDGCFVLLSLHFGRQGAAFISRHLR